MKPPFFIAIVLIGWTLATAIAVLLLASPGHAYAPADGATMPPPPRPPMVCTVVGGQMKCEVR